MGTCVPPVLLTTRGWLFANRLSNTGLNSKHKARPNIKTVSNQKPTAAKSTSTVPCNHPPEQNKAWHQSKTEHIRINPYFIFDPNPVLPSFNLSFKACNVAIYRLVVPDFRAQKYPRFWVWAGFLDFYGFVGIGFGQLLRNPKPWVFLDANVCMVPLNYSIQEDVSVDRTRRDQFGLAFDGLRIYTRC